MGKSNKKQSIYGNGGSFRASKDARATEQEEGKFADDDIEASVPVELTSMTELDKDVEMIFSSDGLMGSSKKHKAYSPNRSKGKELPTTSKSTTKKATTNRGAHDDVEDAAETGKWGSISKREVCVASFLFMGVILAVVFVVVAVLSTRDDGNGRLDDGSGGSPVSEVTPGAPSMPADTFARLDSQQRLDILRDLVGRNPITVSYLNILPKDAGTLEGVSSDETAAPIVRAASWLVHEDAMPAPDQLVARFALATIYFTNGGDDWVKASNWFSATSVCDDWYGVTCYFNSERIEEVDLSRNNLQGPIPEVLTLLTDVRALWLSDNALSGEIPGEVFGSLDSLVNLYLQENQLEGSVPASLQKNGVLRTLFLQDNALTGAWPESFCPPCEGCEHPFYQFGLNCKKITCDAACCSPGENCFE